MLLFKGEGARNLWSAPVGVAVSAGSGLFDGIRGPVAGPVAIKFSKNSVTNIDKL